jgi:hypothetical protein
MNGGEKKAAVSGAPCALLRSFLQGSRPHSGRALGLQCIRTGLLASLMVIWTSPIGAADDAALKALQQNQLERQQQQDQLQLRMQQYQRNIQNPPADARQRQSIEQLELNQQLRQQQLHQLQQRELQTRPEPLTDDEGTRRAKAQIEQQRAQQQSRRQLEQFERERQAEIGNATRERPILPGTEPLDPGSLRLAP